MVRALTLDQTVQIVAAFCADKRRHGIVSQTARFVPRQEGTESFLKGCLEISIRCVNAKSSPMYISTVNHVTDQEIHMR